MIITLAATTANQDVSTLLATTISVCMRLFGDSGDHLVRADNTSGEHSSFSRRIAEKSSVSRRATSIRLIARIAEKMTITGRLTRATPHAFSSAMDKLLMLFGSPAAMLTGPWIRSTNILPQSMPNARDECQIGTRLKVEVGPCDGFLQTLATIRGHS